MSPDGTTESFASVMHDEFENQTQGRQNGLNLFGAHVSNVEFCALL
jgi:hypothetical protein